MLEALKTFRLVALYSSFTRAAEAAGLTRPAVSQKIKQLEQHFGIALFSRNTRQVSLTPAGETLLAQTERVIQAVRELESSMEAFRRGDRQVLIIGASTLPGESLVPQVLASFRADHPGIEIQVRAGNSDSVLQMLRSREIDLGLVGYHVTDPMLLCEIIAEDEVVLITPPGLDVPDPLPAGRLRELPLILREPGSATRATVLAALQRQGIDLQALRVVAELGSPESVKAAVRSGAGCAFLSRTSLIPGELPAVRVEGVDIRRSVCACWPKDRPLTPAPGSLVAKLKLKDPHLIP